MEAFLHKNRDVQGSFFYVAAGIAAVVALLVAALCIPVHIRILASITLTGGYGEIRIRWLCFAVHIPAKLYLLGGKPMHVDVLHRSGQVRKRIGLLGKKEAPSRWEVSLRSVLMIRRAHVAVHIGVKDMPDVTAILCGVTESMATVAMRLLLPDVRVNIYAIPVYSQEAFQLNLEGIARVRMGKLIGSRLRDRGD